MDKNWEKELNLGWIPIYEEISQKLLKKRSKSGRKELVKILQKGFDEAKWDKTLEDEEPKKNRISLEDICPFTIFRYLNYRWDGAKRTKLLKAIAKQLRVNIGKFEFFEGEDGGEETIPLASRNERIWFFPFKYDSDNREDDINKLWKLFEEALTYANNGKNRAEFIKVYDTCIQVTHTGHNKLSQTLYAIRPRNFPTLDQNVIQYLKKHSSDIQNKEFRKAIIGLDKRVRGSSKEFDGEKYLKIADWIQEEFKNKYGKKDVFVGLSYDAYRDKGKSKNGNKDGNRVPHKREMPNNNSGKYPLNQILYGPPGTGKTYKTAQLAIEIIERKESYIKKDNEFYIKKGKRIVATCTLIGELKGDGKKITLVHRGKVLNIRDNDNKYGNKVIKVHRESEAEKISIDYKPKPRTKRQSINDETKRRETCYKIQKALKDKGMLKEKNNKLIFADDCYFSSPSGGSMQILDRSSAGTRVWRNSMGKDIQQSSDEEVEGGQKSKGNGRIKSEREKVLKKYRQLLKVDQIKFVTFHQSYGYEEFVEGIKPKIKDTDSSSTESSGSSDIEYEVKPGIFRQICTDAEETQAPSTPENTWAVRLWIGPEKTEEREFKQECIDGGYIAVREKRKTEEEEKTRGLQEFQENCKAGDLIIVPAYSTGNDWNIVAVGKLKKRREYSDPSKAGILHWDVRWLWYDLDEPKKLDKYRQGGKQKTHLASGVIIEPIEDIDVKTLLQDIANDNPPYVLIIDEINRGNISKILGELITLLEEDKRLGAAEELQVTLPYSGEKFGVPNNLYIIGTMNTADRSIAFLDTALRRRFQFKEMMPRPELLTQTIEGVVLKDLLIAMNINIKKLLDRDHQIGHSYFMPHKVKAMTHLANVFRNSICPLLDEYFYDRREEIADVLNESPLFVAEKNDYRNGEWAAKEIFNNAEYYKTIYAKLKGQEE